MEGKIPDKEELVAKINQLEERLNDKKEQLLEKAGPGRCCSPRHRHTF